MAAALAHETHKKKHKSRLLDDFEAQMLADRFSTGRLQKSAVSDDVLLDGYVIVDPTGWTSTWDNSRIKFDLNHAEAFLADHGYVSNSAFGSRGEAAAKLASDHLWCLKLYPSTFINPGLGQVEPAYTSPETSDAINNAPPYKTSIDFVWISGNEGGQWRRGYFPFDHKSGVISGTSGLTIGSGFDVGQFKLGQIQDTDFKRIEPRFVVWYQVQMTGKDAEGVKDKIRSLGPVPVFDKKEAAIVDQACFTYKKNELINFWDNAHKVSHPTKKVSRTALDGQIAPKKPLKSFGELSENWQTVLADFEYLAGHLYGHFKKENPAGEFEWSPSKFGDLAISGDARGAKKFLSEKTDGRNKARYNKIKEDESGFFKGEA